VPHKRGSVDDTHLDKYRGAVDSETYSSAVSPIVHHRQHTPSDVGLDEDAVKEKRRLRQLRLEAKGALSPSSSPHSDSFRALVSPRSSQQLVTGGDAGDASATDSDGKVRS
jgi:hypothetical protein